MIKQQGIKAKLKSRQQGAVAIIVAICLVVLIGMLGLVLDLGHLYVTKTELQNAADAAALSGAKELNGEMSGINNAITRAIETADKNKYDLNSKSVNITSANLWVGACPSDSCMVAISSVTAATAVDKTFLKVDTGSRGMNTWFIQVLSAGSTTTQTFGMAVAGKYAVDITPIAVCKLPHDPTDPTMVVSDFGYKRGVTYRVSDSNPIGPGTEYWIDPVTVTDTPIPNPGTCTGSTDASLPYVCAGKVDFTPLADQYVYTNTGISTPQLGALDSRFNLYSSDSKCTPTNAPPDSNIKSYAFDDSSGGQPKDWMTNAPAQQSMNFGYYKCDATSCSDQCIKGKGPETETCTKTSDDAEWRPKPFALQSDNDYGVLWSASRPIGRTVDNWSTLYKGQTAKNYPEPSPYAQGSGSPFYQTPTVNAGQPGRRLLNIVIVQCSAAGGNCNAAKVLGIGRFFLQREVVVPSKTNVYLEFAGILPTPLPTSDIRLYR